MSNVPLQFGGLPNAMEGVSALVFLWRRKNPAIPLGHYKLDKMHHATLSLTSGATNGSLQTNENATSARAAP